MLRAIATRLATFAVSLLVASVLVFGALNLLPGDVAQTVLGANATPEAVAQLRAQLGLDRPAALRYLDWLGGMLTGELGTSALTGQGVGSLIAPKLAVTTWLVVLAMTLAGAIALPVGMFSALNRRRWSGFAASAISQIGMAVPAFLAGILLVWLFAVRLRWLPANGYASIGTPQQWIAHLVLPVISLALVQGAVLTRYVRSGFIEVLGEDYYRTARAIGWRKVAGLWRHGVRNASLSVVTVLGLQLATLFVGAIVVEQVFVLPGLGAELLNRVQQRDLPVVQGIVMVLVALVLLINALVDLAYLLLDPRLRSGSARVAVDL